MKLWIKVIRGHKISRDTVFETDGSLPIRPEGWAALFGDALKPMDIAVPVVLSRHVRDFESFQKAVFRASDFMERIDFDHLEIDILPEKKRETQHPEYISKGV